MYVYIYNNSNCFYHKNDERSYLSVFILDIMITDKPYMLFLDVALNVVLLLVIILIIDIYIYVFPSTIPFISIVYLIWSIHCHSKKLINAIDSNNHNTNNNNTIICCDFCSTCLCIHTLLTLLQIRNWNELFILFTTSSSLI